MKKVLVIVGAIGVVMGLVVIGMAGYVLWIMRGLPF